METESLLKAFAQNAILQKCKPAEIEALQTVCKGRNYKKSGVIFTETDEVKGLHIIVSGKVKLFKTLPDGNMQILKIAAPGELIGYRGLLGNQQYIATAEALEHSTLYLIPSQYIIHLITHNAQFALALMAKLASDISEVEEKSIYYVQKNSTERLAETLLKLEEKYGLNPSYFLSITLTREELGAYAGLASETVIRILKKWESEKILQLEKRAIKICDKNKLLAIANL